MFFMAGFIIGALARSFIDFVSNDEYEIGQDLRRNGIYNAAPGPAPSAPPEPLPMNGESIFKGDSGWKPEPPELDQEYFGGGPLTRKQIKSRKEAL